MKVLVNDKLRLGVEPNRAISSRFHHGSHRKLLDVVSDDDRGLATVDAIIVPAARAAAQLRHVIEVAAKLGCTLLVLCSKSASPSKARVLAEQRGVELFAVDTSSLPSGLVPPFQTTQLLDNPTFERRVDTSLKRNLGLLIAHLARWQRVVFLDDDIVIPNPVDLSAAAYLTGSYSAVGLANGGFRDNSVVCYAHYQAGGAQDTFIGGGALAVSEASMMTSFFPNIYNEDWFFLLDDARLRPVAMTGTAVQKRYDPFDELRRARSQELGDCLAEGLFWLLDNGRRVCDANFNFWQEFLDNRLNFITEVIARIADSDHDTHLKYRMIECLKASRGRCQLIRPAVCVDYLRAWRADSTRWRKHLAELRGLFAAKGSWPAHVKYPLEKLLPDLGLMHHTHYTKSRPSSQLQEQVRELAAVGHGTH